VSFLDVLFGKRCDMCGRRGSDVVTYVRDGMDLHARCKRQIRRSDRG
jgi:hypothetical protein